MKRLFGVLLLAGAALAVGADDKKDDAVKDELKKLEGTWLVISAEANGEKASADDIKTMKWVVKDNKLELTLPDKVTKGTLTIDPSKKPKTIDLVITESDGERLDALTLAIYELDGDNLKICLAEDKTNKERPKEFSAKKGSKAVLFECKREKK